MFEGSQASETHLFSRNPFSLEGAKRREKERVKIFKLITSEQYFRSLYKSRFEKNLLINFFMFSLAFCHVE